MKVLKSLLHEQMPYLLTQTILTADTRYFSMFLFLIIDGIVENNSICTV